MKTLSTIITLTSLSVLASAEVVDGDKGQLVQGPEIHGPSIEAPGKAEANPPIQLEVGELIPANPKPQTEAIPKEYAGEKVAAIKLEGLKHVGERLAMQAVLRIINPTDKPMVFTGYSEKSPITQIQHWKDGKWVDEERVLRCGTGLRACTIAPGQSAVFHAAVYGATMPTRIGVAYSTNWKDSKRQTAWSVKIER